MSLQLMLSDHGARHGADVAAVLAQQGEELILEAGVRVIFVALIAFVGSGSDGRGGHAGSHDRDRQVGRFDGAVPGERDRGAEAALELAHVARPLGQERPRHRQFEGERVLPRRALLRCDPPEERRHEQPEILAALAQGAAGAG